MPTPQTPSDPSAAAPIPVPHEERFRQAWERYGNTVYTMCAIVVAGILAKGGWDYLVAQKEFGIQKEFAECTSVEAFRAFASSHPGHPPSRGGGPEGRRQCVRPGPFCGCGRRL